MLTTTIKSEIGEFGVNFGWVFENPKSCEVKRERERERNTNKTLFPLRSFFVLHTLVIPIPILNLVSFHFVELHERALKRHRPTVVSIQRKIMAHKPHLQQLRDLGSKLDNLPSSKDALIKLLKVFSFLSIHRCLISQFFLNWKFWFWFFGKLERFELVSFCVSYFRYILFGF